MKIRGKIFKTGSGYAMTIPKALVDAEILEVGHVEFEIEQPLALNNNLKDRKRSSSMMRERFNPVSNFYENSNFFDRVSEFAI